MCMFSAFAAAIFSFKEKSVGISKKINDISSKFIYEISRIGWFITEILTCGLMVIKLLVWFRGGYSAIIVFEAAVD